MTWLSWVLIKRFQSTHLCKVRPRASKKRTKSLRIFQSTHLCKVRRNVIFLCLFQCVFQSTHLCKVRRTIPTAVASLVGFQSTHLCKVRHGCGLTKNTLSIGFQSTHLCKVRQRTINENSRSD